MLTHETDVQLESTTKAMMKLRKALEEAAVAGGVDLEL